MVSGGAESDDEEETSSHVKEKDAVGGVSVMLVERVFRRTVRGASTFGFSD